MAKEPPAPEPADETAITPADREAAFSVSATYVDTWLISTWQGHVRIALGEQSRNPGADKYRFAILMEDRDAENLLRELREALDQSKIRYEQSDPKPT